MAKIEVANTQSPVCFETVFLVFPEHCGFCLCEVLMRCYRYNNNNNYYLKSNIHKMFGRLYYSEIYAINYHTIYAFNVCLVILVFTVSHSFQNFNFKTFLQNLKT